MTKEQKEATIKWLRLIGEVYLNDIPIPTKELIQIVKEAM